MFLSKSGPIAINFDLVAYIGKLLQLNALVMKGILAFKSQFIILRKKRMKQQCRLPFGIFFFTQFRKYPSENKL